MFVLITLSCNIKNIGLIKIQQIFRTLIKSSLELDQNTHKLLQTKSMNTSHILKTTIIILAVSISQIHNQKISEVLKTHQSQIFQNYKSKYSKKYKDESQQLYRNLLVYNNANKIASHNLNLNKTYTLSINNFADLSDEQFRLKYASYQVSGESIRENIRLEKRKKQLEQRQCLCDSFRINQQILIDQRGQIIKRFLNQSKQFKKKKKDQSILSLERNITLFQQNVPLLSPDQIQVTSAMKKQIQANSLKINQPASAINLKKDPPPPPPPAKNKIPTAVPNLSVSSAMSYANKIIYPGTSTTNSLSSPADLIQKSVLTSLGDKQITTPINTASSPLLKQTLTTPTSSSTTTSTATTTTIMTSAATTTTTPTTISIDWSNFTGVAHHQGLCGSCYAMVAAQNVQALYAIYSFGFYVQLSTQQILDCSDNGLTFGCDGGYLEGSLLYIKNKGINTQKVYPYTSGLTGTAGTCKSATGPFKITQFRNLAAGDCAVIKKQLSKKPVAVAIASFNLQFYQSGTFTDCNNDIDHAVLLVGFHSTKGWKIKNSWGTSWGQAGYAWIQDGNSCGICQGGIVASIPGEPVL